MRYLARLLATLLFCSYIIFGFITSILSANGNRGAALLYGTTTLVVGLFAILIELVDITKRYKSIYQITGILLFGLLLSSLINNVKLTGMLFNLMTVLSNMGITLLLLRRRFLAFSLPLTYLLFGCVVAYLAYYFYIGTNPNEIFANSSRNTISWLLIMYSAILYIVADKVTSESGLKNPSPTHNSQKPNVGISILLFRSAVPKLIHVLPAVMTLFLSVMSYGRSGIISSFVLFIGILLLNFYEKNKKSGFYIVMSFLAVLLLFLVSNLGGLGNTVNNVSHYFDYFRTVGLSDKYGRELIWRNYFSQMDLTRLFFGVNPGIDSSVTRWNNNYHNSFVYLHAMFGMVGIIFIFLQLWSMVRLLNLNNLLLLIIITVSLRSFSDTGMFLSQYDFILYYIIGYAMLYSGRFGGNRESMSN